MLDPQGKFLIGSLDPMSTAFGTHGADPATRQEVHRGAADRQLREPIDKRGPTRGPAPAPSSARVMRVLRQTHRAGEWTLFDRTGRIGVRKIHRIGSGLRTCLVSTLLIALTCPGALACELSIRPGSVARVGTVDDRFQSYNVEMIEVTGGRFWKPYGPITSDAHSDLYQYRGPIDLNHSRVIEAAGGAGAHAY